ncbi:MAG TPA: hypothetical protein QGH10_01980, partial [Armatimonadota bacterium]|nr:hypothetical protein [Armatimonadota bacterium]
MRLRNIITAIIALTIVAGTAVAQDELPKSLIDRGDFEGTLGGWERGHGAIELDEDTPHDGAGAVRLTDGARLQTPLIPYTEEFVRVALWMRTEGVERGAEAWHQAGGQIAWYDAEKNSMGHSDIGLTVGTTDWTQHETRFFREAKDGVAYISVGLMIWNATGTAWFDDVVVEATEPPEEYIKVPLLEQVENDPPIFWPVPPLQDADQPVDMGPVEVNFTATRDFMIRPADAAAPEVSRVDIKVGGGGNMGYTESGWEAASGWHHRYKY